MKKFTIGLVMLFIGGMGLSAIWDSNTHKKHQIEKYQKEMADRDKTIKGLEDSILQLNGRIEMYDATWDYLRGIDSFTIDGAIYRVRKFYEYDEQYYYDAPMPINYKIVVS